MGKSNGTKAQQRAVDKYVKENYDRFGLRLKKGELARFKGIAEQQGVSLNQYFLDKIYKDE